MQASYKVWLIAEGAPPWPCFRCGEPVLDLGGRFRSDMTGIIHHHDRDHFNNEITNLRVMHHACHVAEHQRLTYRALAEMIREQIRSGELVPNRRIPSLRQLQAEHDVAPMTVRRAFQALADEGLVITKPGRGTFVTP